MSFIDSEISPELIEECDRLNRTVMGANFEIITAKRAMEFLEKNYPHNRNVDQGRIKALEIDIMMDKYKPNGEPILFDTDKFMINGQHTCYAVKNTGKAIIKNVIYNIPNDRYDTLDGSKERKLPGILSSEGVPHYKTCSGVARLIYCYLISPVGKEEKRNGGKVPKLLGKDVYYDNEAEILHAVKKCFAWNLSSKIGATTLLSYCYYYIDNYVGRKEADDFFKKLYLGINLGVGNPILYLRDRLIKDKDLKSNEGGKVIQYVISTFKTYIEGRNIVSLSKLEMKAYL